MQVFAENFVSDDRPGVDGIDISPPRSKSWHSQSTVTAPSFCTLGWSSLTQNPNKKDTKRCVLPLNPSLSKPLIPPAPSPCSSPPRPPSPPEAAPPPPHALSTQRNAAASLHAAARGSGQAGTPSLLASFCAPCCTRGPLCTTPPQYRERERERERERDRKRGKKRERKRAQDRDSDRTVCVALCV